jgi:tRNA-Thr(GGU) m(6)t(6)A37 methyltransferase TsaA
MINHQIIVKPVAYVQNPRSSLEDDHWGSVISEIILENSFPEECLDGIETFSHVEILFYFDKISDKPRPLMSRHPRDNKDWPRVGIFAQRNKDRPNHIGLSIAKIIKREGRSLFVQGLDAVNGTPVIDIKPIMVEYLLREPVTQPEWSHELMKNYWNQ